MKDFEAYSNRINEELSNENPVKVYNKDISHAAVITSAAFRYASTEVRLLSHKLDRALYNENLLENSVAPFLARRGTLHILVETDLPSTHPIWGFMEEGSYSHEQLTIKKVPPELVDRYQFNYLVADEFGYRFEADREEYAAVASFHESDSVSTIKDLVGFFDKLERQSSDVQYENN